MASLGRQGNERSDNYDKIREVAHYDCTGTLGFIWVAVFIWADSTIRGFAISLVTLAMLAFFSAELVCLDLVL